MYLCLCNKSNKELFHLLLKLSFLLYSREYLFVLSCGLFHQIATLLDVKAKVKLIMMMKTLLLKCSDINEALKGNVDESKNFVRQFAVFEKNKFVFSLILLGLEKCEIITTLLTQIVDT